MVDLIGFLHWEMLAFSERGGSDTIQKVERAM
jgi:hypothetical protein